MEQEKRALVAVALCLVVLFSWPFLMGAVRRVTGMPDTSKDTISQSGTTPAATPPPSAAAPPSATPSAPAAGTPAQPGTDAAAAAPVPPPVPAEQLLVVEQPLYRATITSYGAALSRFELLAKQYQTRDRREVIWKDGQPQRNIMQTEGPTNLLPSYRPSVRTEFTSGYKLPAVPAYTLVSDEKLPDGDRRVVYALETPDFRIEKAFTFPTKLYQVGVQVTVENRRSTDANHHLAVTLEGYQDPEQKPGGIFSARVPQNEAVWQQTKKMRNLNLEALLDGKADPDHLRGNLRWFGIGQQYFLSALALPQSPQLVDKLGKVMAQKNGEITFSVEFSDQSLKPGEKRVYPMVLFAGPKLPDLLDGVTIEGQSAGLSSAIDYTFEVLARPLLWVLRQIEGLVHNWALAIVLLTCLVKLVLLYPSHRSMVSMKAMGKLKPQLDALKEKCGDDKQRFQMEMMALYKRHNINPVGGCLPILLQMPIYFALYSMLGNAVELYHVRLWWIPDMTTADPYFVMPLAAGALMYLQTKLSPAPPDPQQKAMVVMMPVIFTVFSIFLPAGLTLYIVTNTVLGMVQQVVVNRSTEGEAQKVAVAAASTPAVRERSDERGGRPRNEPGNEPGPGSSRRRKSSRR